MSVAVAKDPLDLIPADALACWSSGPLPDAPQGDDQGSPLATLVDLGTRLAGAKLDRSTQITLRLFEAFSNSIRFPLTIALMDVQAKPAELNPDARKLDRFQVIAAIQAGGDSERLRRIIQKVVNEQTDQANATIESLTAGRWSYQELRDKRKADLGAIAWGQIDDCFVITLGDGIWARVAEVAGGKSASLPQEKWIAAVRTKHNDRPMIEIFGSFQRLAERLDPSVQGRASQFFSAWGLADVQRGWWALGFEGRALYSRATFEQAGFTRERLYADPRENAPELLAVVPEKARYAVYTFPAGLLVDRACRAWFALFDAQERAKTDRRWQRVLTQTGVDPQRDILNQLGERLVLHNSPPHPLHLPMAFTTLIEIRGDSAKLRRAMDSLLTAWATETENDAGESGSFDLFALRHDGDGVWYIGLGPVAGVAWTTTERFLVASWSPQALRLYLHEMGSKLGKR